MEWETCYEFYSRVKMITSMVDKKLNSIVVKVVKENDIR